MKGRVPSRRRGPRTAPSLPDAANAAEAVGSTGALPYTGAETAWLLVAGLALLVGGAALRLTGRRS